MIPRIIPRGRLIMRANLYGPTSTKSPVSAGAVIKRVNRRTKTLGLILKAMRPGPRREYFGQFCLVGPEGLVTEKHVDLEQTARELGVLTDDEEIRTPSARIAITTMVAENG
jgi:hypothetical protein